MKESVIFLTKFSQLLRNEVLDYYNKTHLYLKDLVSYKNVDLREDPRKRSEESLRDKLLNMLKAITTGLNTIGVSINKLSKIQNNYLEEINTKGTILHDYDSYLKLYFTEYIDKILFEILIEYLLDQDTQKIETLKLFKLTPQSFIDKLNEFKKTSLDSKTKKFISFPGIEENLNFSDLSIKLKTFNVNPKQTFNSRMKKVEEINNREEKISEESTILAQLQEVKKDFIETLNTPKKELLKPSLEELEYIIHEAESPKSIQEINSTSASLTKNNLNALKPVSRDLILEKMEENFLDLFGHLPSVHLEFLDKFKINFGNLLNSRVVNPDFLDLENLFYYISILKMGNIEFPFTSMEILDSLRNHITEMIFSITRNVMPDSINIFYGLSIITELNLIHKTNIVNLYAIEEFLKMELKNFIPERLKLNYYTLLCLKLLAKSEIISSRKDVLLNQVKNLDLLNMKNFNPTLDIYNQLAIIKTLDRNANLNRFILLYMSELKKLLTSKGGIKDSITESAKTLLILVMFNLKEQESVLCSRLLNYIINFTDFFNLENLDKEFNWRIDKLAYKIELKMLFWALLACSQYSPDNLLNL
ncbi:MAG: hypothetical protein ACFFG0_15190 [Candidatus Thorarchaeota archaeon]